MNRSEWRHPIALVALTEAGYLIYFHVAASVSHGATLFGWLPLGAWKVADPGGAALLYSLCLGALFALYAWLLAILARREERPGDRMTIFGGAALFSITLVFLPALMSKDLYDYMGHGRVLAVHGANPFVSAASDFPPDEFTRAMGWASATPLYGPAWASISALLAMAGGGSFVLTALIFKLFFAAVHLINGLLVMTVARGWREPSGGPGPRPLGAAAFYLWNPLVLTQVVGDAHNDGVVLLWILLGVWMLQRRDDITGAAGIAMSVMVKYVTAPLALLLALQKWREAGGRRALLFCLTGAAVAALAYAPYLSGFDAAHFLRPYEHSSYQGGLMMMIEMTLGQVIPGAHASGSALARVMLAVSLFAAAGLGLWFLRACWRVETLMEAVEAGTWLLLLYLLLVTALLRTSYIVWIVGLAAILAAGRLRRVVAIFSGTALALEVLWVYRLLLPPPPPPVAVPRLLASAVAVGAPILYLLLRFRERPWSRKPAEP